MNEINIWDECLRAFDDVLTDKDMKTWFLPLEVKQNSSTLRVIAPNRFIRDQIESEYLTLIKETVALKSSNSITEVTLMLPGSPQAVPRKNWNERLRNNINNDLTFENFVEGKSNQLAKAACVSVVSEMGQYNPLYIYGGVGLGKTHLLHSIGNAILQKDPNKTVVYLHSEKFVQNMVTALQKNQIEEFKKIYRSVDALLLDDVQFFAGKERSQEEFFHTFNSLFEYKKQVVLTSDKYPKEITGLEERIKSRLVWGMNVMIDPPDLETRMAIVHKKAELARSHVNDDVAYYLAKNIYSNVRELEGSLRRLIATSNFKKEEITLDFTKETLKDLVSLQERLITVEQIQKIVAGYYKIRVSDILSTKRDRKIAFPRHMAMAISKDITSHSLPSIGDAFGGRDHTTVMHAVKKIEELKLSDVNFNEDLELLKRLIDS